MNTRATRNNKQSTPLLTMLLAAMATLGLLAAACGDNQANTDTTISPAVSVEEPASAVSTTPTTAAATTTTTGEVVETVPAADAPTTVPPVTAAQSDLPPPPAGGSGPEPGFEEPCFAIQPADPAATQRQAEAMLPELKTLFPTLDHVQVGNLAFPYAQCGVTAADVEAVLGDGELGDQYRTMVEALKTDSYRTFMETYLTQPCLIGAHDFNAKIQSSVTNLRELVGAVSGAAYSQFDPSVEELEAIGKGLLTEMMNSFQQAFEAGGEVDDSPDDSSQPVTCKQFSESVSQRRAAS